MCSVILTRRSGALGRKRKSSGDGPCRRWKSRTVVVGALLPPAVEEPRVQSTSRPGLVLTVALLLVLTMTMAVPASALGARRIGIDEFMTGLACVESGGRFNAFNPGSRSYGKFQVMPHNWSAWAARYLGNRWAAQTPRNQEYVARQRILDLYRLHHRWRLVAHWWLTGNADGNEQLWSRGSIGYVDSVMTVAHMAASAGARGDVPARCFPASFRTPRIRTEPWPRATVAGRRVHLRTAAGYENRATDTVTRGMTLAVLGRDRDARGKPWLHVGLRDGRQGWIAAWFTQRSAQ